VAKQENENFLKESEQLFIQLFNIILLCLFLQAKAAKDFEKRERYSNISRTISWIGLVLFAVAISITVIAFAIS